VYAARTRFIPNTLLPLFERTTWPKIVPDVAALRPSQSVRIDLAARMRAMWRQA
jgi:DNA helicase-2/ATP-dependent DNA helicase PcrA